VVVDDFVVVIIVGLFAFVVLVVEEHPIIETAKIPISKNESHLLFIT
jgi:hypothetical protein